MPTFFDSSLLEKHGAAFIDEQKIEEALKGLISNALITKGRTSYPSRSELRDLVWNHMDQNHRPYIHRTYEEALRVYIGKRASFSLTRFGRWPIVIPVFDGYFRENGFYQVMVLFGLITVITVIECNPSASGTQMEISWMIASTPWLRFLHKSLSKRIVRLNEVQNREDDPIRDRRMALRSAGYRFNTDEPDFMNSNAMAHNVIFPPLVRSLSIPIAEISEGQPRRVEFADRAFIVRRLGEAVEVWPGTCPHEGAAITTEDLDGKAVKCRWHGLEFGPRRLSGPQSSVTICGARLELSGTQLVIGPVQ